MLFPLLESLLQKDPGSSISHIHKFLQTEVDLTPIFKSILTFSSQHAVHDDSNMDAVVVSAGLINVIQNRKELTSAHKEILFGHGIDFLCGIPIEAVDSSLLKPARDETRVVSISDVEESFESDDVRNVIHAVRDLLGLMDNKHYFMEIMCRIALEKSVRSICLASATSRAIEIMGWQNNFTPFLIYHLVVKMFHDRDRYEHTSADKNEDSTFEKSLASIQSVNDAQFISALLRMYNESKILVNKISPLILMRMSGFSHVEKITNDFSSADFSPIDRIVFHSCMEDLRSIAGSGPLSQKIPFVV